MLLTTKCKVANNAQHASLCIEQNSSEKPSIPNRQRQLDDDSSQGTLVETDSLSKSIAVIPDNQNQRPTEQPRQHHALPKAVVPLKPRARLPQTGGFNTDSYTGPCIRKQGLSSISKPELPLPSLTSSPDVSTKEDSDEVPDLVAEDHYADNDSSEDYNRRTIWPAHKQPSNLKSSLKKNKASSHTGCAFSNSSNSSLLRSSSLRKRPTTQRRVRGLWATDSTVSDNESRFDELRDQTLERIFSFLDLADLCRAGMVGRRWSSIAHNTPSLWKRIDASSFVQKAYQTFHQNTDLTGQAIEAILKRHKPQALVIRDIHQSLSADTYLPSISSLKELVISKFDNLTDTHIHVMLLMTLNKKQSNNLQVLALEDCPLLTNASIRSITATCTNLTHLSLRGTERMTDASPLAPLLATKRKKAMGLAATAAAPPPSLASFSAFFAPPTTPPRPPMSPVRPSTPPNTNTSSLQSLFAPPGMSPPRKSATLSTLPGSTPLSNAEGKLQHLHLQDTQITVQSLVQCLKKRTESAPPSEPVLVNLKSLTTNGDTWTDSLMGDFSQAIALEELRELSLATASATTRGGQLTNKGVKTLARNATPRFSKLKTLDLDGQTNITGLGLASLISHSASPELETLKINECHGVASDTKGMDRLVKAVVKNKSLKRLHMRGVMSSTMACNSSSQQVKEWQCWERFLEDVSDMGLEHLDVRDCWPATTTDTTTASANNNTKNNNSVEALRSAVPTVLY